MMSHYKSCQQGNVMRACCTIHNSFFFFLNSDDHPVTITYLLNLMLKKFITNGEVNNNTVNHHTLLN